jgi:wyosine [tRNA(Phe)-imidazoG37] synthetase (radical SAM superfamily)
MQVERSGFYEPAQLFRAVQSQVERTRKAGERIDYLTFVPDGEPTLDAALGREIELLKPLDLPIAVITNGSLLWRQDVRKDLMAADWVSVKVDAVAEGIWRRVNRPPGSLALASILEGALRFARDYRGELVTETMLVAGVNDDAAHLEEIASFLARLQPSRAYLSVPTRPPAEEWAKPPDEQDITRAYQILGQKVLHVEYLIGYEGNAFAFTGDVEEDLLSITAVHPMRKEAVTDFLARAKADWSTVRRLTEQGRLIETEYQGQAFYMRKLPNVSRS